MRKLIPMLLLLVIAGTGLYGQNGPPSRSNHIKGGFYMKFGPSFPVGSFNAVQYSIDERPLLNDTLKQFERAKPGICGDFGYLIYIGPSFANHFLRAGIDATFFSGGFNTSHHVYTSGEQKSDYYYFFAGQKFGPVITVNPVDRLMIDLSWKLCFAASEYNDDWGYNMTLQEISMGIRYRIIAFSLNYQMGKIDYNDFNKNNPEQWADVNMVKVMVGLKF